MAQSSANTFGTFLETFRQLESTPRPERMPSAEKEAFLIAKALISTGGGPLDIKQAMSMSGLPQDVFFSALIAGKEKGLFSVDDSPATPTLELTKLGRALVG